MKEIKMFMFEGCPHCRKASDLIKSLIAVEPKYSDIPFVMIDERLQPEVADKYDYFYVPTFYVGEKKVHEGKTDEHIIKMIFEKAFE